MEATTLEARRSGGFGAFMSGVMLGGLLTGILFVCMADAALSRCGLQRISADKGNSKETESLAKQVETLGNVLRMQDKRMSDVAGNHNKLVGALTKDMAAIRGNIAVFDSTFRGLEAVLVELHGTNVWEEAKAKVAEEAKKLAKDKEPKAEVESDNEMRDAILNGRE